MDINTMKAQVRTLASAVEAGTATEEQVSELETLVATVEARQAQAALAARAVAAAATTEAIETEAPVAEGTIGQVFARSASFDKRGKSDVVSADIQFRAATTTGDIVVNPTIDSVATPGFKAPFTSIVSVSPVSTNDVTFIVESPVYPSGIFTAEGDVKPEVEFAYSPTSVVLGTMAGFTKASRQALSDSAALAGSIDRALSGNLVRKVEAHIAATIAAADIDSVTAANLLSGIRLGQAAVDELYASSAVVLNPADAAAIDLQILTGTLNGAVINGKLWGLNVVTSSAVAVGTAFVGDFASAVKFYTKGSVDVFTTDADGDDFKKNIVTILAEARGKAAVVAPAALRKIIVD